MRLYILLGTFFVVAGVGAWVLLGSNHFVSQTQTSKDSGSNSSYAPAQEQEGNASTSTDSVPPQANKWPLAFDRYHFSVGDTIGNFLVTSGESSIQPQTPDPYPQIEIELSGTTTIIGTLNASLAEMCGGTYIEDITPKTAATLPHPSDEKLPTTIMISNDNLKGADTVYNGDIVAVPIMGLSLTEAPKDCGGYVATAHSIRLVQAGSPKPYLTGSPVMKRLLFNMPPDWHMISNEENGVVLVSPDFSTRQTLADILTGTKPWITSGRKITISYQEQHISPSMSAQDFIDFEKGIKNDCSNCEASQNALIGTLPALAGTATQGPNSWTTVSADNHSDEVDVTFEPAIRSDADRAFMLNFLNSISLTN